MCPFLKTWEVWASTEAPYQQTAAYDRLLLELVLLHLCQGPQLREATLRPIAAYDWLWDEPLLSRFFDNTGVYSIILKEF